MSAKGYKPVWVYLVAVTALIASVWIGCAGVDLHVPQETVREVIRAAPRTVVQILVQFVVPVLLIGFLASEGMAFARSRRKA
jgi:hypothetical protein